MKKHALKIEYYEGSLHDADPNSENPAVRELISTMLYKDTDTKWPEGWSEERFFEEGENKARKSAEDPRAEMRFLADFLTSRSGLTFKAWEGCDYLTVEEDVPLSVFRIELEKALPIWASRFPSGTAEVNGEKCGPFTEQVYYYRYMSEAELRKMLSGKRITGHTKAEKYAYTNSEGVCFLGRETLVPGWETVRSAVRREPWDPVDFGHEDSWADSRVFTPEQCHFLHFITSGECLAEFAAAPGKEMKETHGRYAAPYYTADKDVFKAKEYCTPSYDRTELEPVRFCIARDREDVFNGSEWFTEEDYDLDTGCLKKDLPSGPPLPPAPPLPEGVRITAIRPPYGEDFQHEGKRTWRNLRGKIDRDDIPGAPAGWWWVLSSRGRIDRRPQVLIQEGGKVRYAQSSPYDAQGIRPVIVLKGKEEIIPHTGERFSRAGHTWTVFSPGLAICDSIVGKAPFRDPAYEGKENPDNWWKDQCDYINAWLSSWAEKSGLGIGTDGIVHEQAHVSAGNIPAHSIDLLSLERFCRPNSSAPAEATILTPAHEKVFGTARPGCGRPEKGKVGRFEKAPAHDGKSGKNTRRER